MDIVLDLLTLLLVGATLFFLSYVWALWITFENKNNPPKYKVWLSIIGFAFIFLALGGLSRINGIY